MSVRSLLAAGLISVSTSFSACAATPPAGPVEGGIEVVIHDATRAATTPGALTLTRNDGTERWQLPLSGRSEQTRRLSVPPGLYTLDYESDASLALAFPRSPEPAQLRDSGAFPRWVVVASARVTQIVLRIDAEQSSSSDTETALLRFPLN